MRMKSILRETEWYAVIAIVLLVAALVIATLIAAAILTPLMWSLAVVLSCAAIVSAIFSHRV